jgi:nucleotide-binding universal stress UspA family protein
MKMLLCTIGSRKHEYTLRFGAKVAKALAADLTLVGVVDKKHKVDSLTASLEEVGSDLVNRGLPVQVRVLHGDAEQVVIQEMQQTAYDLVALGTLGSKRSRRQFFNTVGVHIIDQAESSVLLIKGDRLALSSVLICTSGAEQGHLAVWAGAALACGAAAKATVLHVVDALPSMYTGLEQMEETLAELLQTDTEPARQLRWASQVVKAECDVSEIKLRRGIVADEILREGRVGDHDLIILGSSKSGGGLRRALMRDLAREVVTRATRPVLVVRPIE